MKFTIILILRMPINNFNRTSRDNINVCLNSAEIFFNYFLYRACGNSLLLILINSEFIQLTIRTLCVISLKLNILSVPRQDCFSLLFESYSFFIRDFSFIRTGSHHANKGERVLRNSRSLIEILPQ